MAMGQIVRIASMAALVLTVARVGHGQTTTTGRPFQALFGPTPSEQTRPRQLDLNWSLYGAQDDNSFLSSDGDILDTALQNDQMYTGGSLSLTYTRRSFHKALSLNSASAARFYPDLHRMITTRSSGSVAFDVVPAERWTVQTAGSVSYSPYYTVVLGAAPPLSGLDLIGPSADYAASRQDSVTYASYVGARGTLSQKSSLNMVYGLRYTDFLGGSQLMEQRAGIGYTRSLSKGFALDLGYQQLTSTSVGGLRTGAVDTRNVGLGLAYNRALFNSSRTTLTVTSGTTTVSAGGTPQFMVTGSAHLRRQLSRLWFTQLLYDRGVQVPEGTLRPFFSDTVGASVSGYFNSRVMLLAGPTYARGTVGGPGQGNAYNSLANTLRVEIALGRRAALFAEHFYYRYEFDNNADLPSMMAGALNRNGARVGLTLWTPVIR
jgi:hypothetical protein